MEQTRSNVILITCDCLRADMVGCCADSSGASLTPNLDRFASRGIAFSAAFAQGFRTPLSVPTLFTGKYPHNLKLAAIQSPFGLRRKFRCLLMGEEQSIAEILADEGYQTAGVHSNPLLTSTFGYKKGFQYFYEDLFLTDARLPAWLKRWLLRLPHLFRLSPYLSAAKLNDKVFGWLTNVKQPFFLWLHYMDAHGPYQSKKGFRYLNKIRSDLLFKKAVKNPKAITPGECQTLLHWYQENVRYIDHHLGNLFTHLEKTGMMNDTLVVLTADHGEEFQEHGRLTHHSALYDEVMRVPLIFKLPYSQHGGRVVKKPVGLVQVLPTILDVLGIRTNVNFDEKSLFPLIDKNDERSLCEFIISQGKFPPKIRASIRTDEWTFILDESQNKGELYDLKNDPKEQMNVIESHTDMAARLGTMLRSSLSQNNGSKKKQEVAQEDVDTEVLQRLRELGYL